MNRNVSIVLVILVLVVIAGYLVWIRSRYQDNTLPVVEEQITVTSAPEVASPSAAPIKEATGSVKEKSATASPTKR